MMASVNDGYKDDRAISLSAREVYEREVNCQREVNAAVTDEEKLKLLRRVVRGKNERSMSCPNQWVLSLAKDARERLVELCQPMILGIAYKVYRRTGRMMEVSDLVSEGNIGLLRLLDQRLRGEVSLGVFYTLASKYSAGYMMTAVEESERMSGRTHKMRRQSLVLARAQERLLSRYGCEPSYQELADEMGITKSKLCELVECSSLERPKSMEALIDAYGGGDRDDFVSLFESSPEILHAGRRERDELLHRALHCALTESQREVLRLRYGLDGPAYPGAVVARELGKRRSWVSYQEEQAKRALRQVLETGEVAEPVMERLGECYTAKEAAQVLGIARENVLRWIKAGRLPGEYVKASLLHKVGQWMLPKEAVDAYAATRYQACD